MTDNSAAFDRIRRVWVNAAQHVHQGAFGVPHRPVNQSDRIISLDASAADWTLQWYAAVPTEQTHAQLTRNGAQRRGRGTSLSAG